MKITDIVRLPLSGSSSAKGRNGYFVAVQAQLGIQGFPPVARLEVFSVRRGDAPPLVLELNRDDTYRLGNLLLAAAAVMP